MSLRPSAARAVALSLFILPIAIGISARADCFAPGDLLELHGIGAPAISPDGEWIAYVLSTPPDTSRGEKRRGSDIWVVGFDGARGPRRYTHTRAREDSPKWSPDGIWIAFRSARSSDGEMQLYRIRFAGGEAEQVADFERGVSSFAWSPEGSRFAVTATEPVPEEVEREREQGSDERVIDAEDRMDRLWIVDAQTGGGEVVTPDDLHVQAFAWSPDGLHIAMIVSDRPGADESYWHSRLEVLHVATGERKLLSENAQGTPSWSYDGASVAFTYLLMHPEVTVEAPLIGVIGADGAGFELFGEKLRSTLRDPRWLPGGEELIVVELAGVTARLSLLSIEDSRTKPIEELLVPYYGSEIYDITVDGSRIAYLKGDVKSPPELYSMSRKFFGKKKRLTNVNRWLKERTLPEARAVRWTSRDGTEVEGVLFLPVGYEEGRTYPAVLNIHGGPKWAWWLGWHGTWHEWAVPLACRGFVVLLPNPRGSVGYGVGFARANFDDWGGGDFEDILAGADFLVEQGYADPERVGIGGWSYGGYMSSWAVTQTRRFAAAVVGAGVTNLFSFHGTTDITPTFLEYYFRDVAYARPDTYRDHSAINYVRQARTPTLILHGEEDVRVPVGQAYEFYHGLRQSAVEAEFVVYPREGHGFGEIRHEIDLLERIIGWFERHLAAE